MAAGAVVGGAASYAAHNPGAHETEGEWIGAKQCKAKWSGEVESRETGNHQLALPNFLSSPSLISSLAPSLVVSTRIYEYEISMDACGRYNC